MLHDMFGAITYKFTTRTSYFILEYMPNICLSCNGKYENSEPRSSYASILRSRGEFGSLSNESDGSR